MSETTRTWITRALIVAGIAQLLFVAVPAIQSARLGGETRQRFQNTSGPVPGGALEVAIETRREARRSGLIGHLEIERLGLSVPVLEETSDRSLTLGVGHVPTTPFPGEPDNVALAGHRDTHFRKLAKVEKGDVIVIDTPDGRFRYRVDAAFVVAPDRGDLLEPTGRPMLTLVTCYPFHWIGPAPDRFIVRASRIGSADDERRPVRNG